MPLSKTQITYLTDKLRRSQMNAKADFAKAHPFAWTNSEIKQKLVEAGFIFSEYSYVKDVQLPFTDEMKRNKVKVDTFNKQVDDAYNEAVDTANLGDSESALALLRDFSATLQELARA